MPDQPPSEQPAPTRRGSSRRWTPEEDSILREVVINSGETQSSETCDGFTDWNAIQVVSPSTGSASRNIYLVAATKIRGGVGQRSEMISIAVHGARTKITHSGGQWSTSVSAGPSSLTWSKPGVQIVSCPHSNILIRQLNMIRVSKTVEKRFGPQDYSIIVEF